jgi:gamma-glutamyltranspeptidase/glutathione hydrolase
MLHTALGYNGAVTAPHRIAALAGRDVLAAGGTAIEAMVAAAAMVAVVYPQMNGIGGDAFWLIQRKGEAPIAISGAGRAAKLATAASYKAKGYDAIPTRGVDAALLVPGAVDTWRLALEYDPANRMPLMHLLAPAVAYAKNGIAVSQSQAKLAKSRLDELKDVPGFADIYLVDGDAPRPGHLLKQTALGQTLEQIGEHGLRSFYEGDIARANGRWLESVGSPLRYEDFAGYRAERVTPLKLETSWGTLYNMIPPTQGIASMMILGQFDRLGVSEAESFAHIHGLVEATKHAYRYRNRELGDPEFMAAPATEQLTVENLDRLAAQIDPARAAQWPDPPVDGDTIWMGAADSSGTVVSFIQSLFWEFGSGVVAPATGVTFENRGAGFSLDPGPNQLAPGKRPFHTLNPALANLRDGRVMSYGNMGGEGQPQTQGAVFTRYAQFGQGLQAAITAPRWLLGKTWGDVNTRLKVEDRFDPALIAELQEAGHDVQLVGPFEDMMGHAGAVVMHPDGLIESATDPRSDGAAIAF